MLCVLVVVVVIGKATALGNGSDELSFGRKETTGGIVMKNKGTYRILSSHTTVVAAAAQM